MRYENINKVDFTTREGLTVAIRDMREYPTRFLLENLKIKSLSDIDEIASRPEIYGQEGERLSYKIVDFNIEAIFERDFKIDKIYSLKIPV